MSTLWWIVVCLLAAWALGLVGLVVWLEYLVWRRSRRYSMDFSRRRLGA